MRVCNGRRTSREHAAAARVDRVRIAGAAARRTAAAQCEAADPRVRAEEHAPHGAIAAAPGVCVRRRGRALNRIILKEKIQVIIVLI